MNSLVKLFNYSSKQARSSWLWESCLPWKQKRIDSVVNPRKKSCKKGAGRLLTNCNQALDPLDMITHPLAS
jgi:hypothetical protein